MKRWIAIIVLSIMSAPIVWGACANMIGDDGPVVRKAEHVSASKAPFDTYAPTEVTRTPFGMTIRNLNRTRALPIHCRRTHVFFGEWECELP